MASAKSGPQEIEFPRIALRHCDTEQYGIALHKARTLPFWWYQDLSRGGRNFSLPFQDSHGGWWYQVRPGFAWPVDAIDPIAGGGRTLPYRATFLGYQFVVPDGEASNSTLVINTILDVPGYGVGSIDDKRRNAIRKGLRACEVVKVDAVDEAWVPGVVAAWNDLVGRTGWKSRRNATMVRETWTRLLDLPATTILLAIDRTSGRVAGFLITKVFGQTAYVDTIASSSDLLSSCPNDALMYAFIRNAQQIPAVRKIHYAIKSNVEPLERFKTSLGFAPNRFPARLCARPGLLLLLRGLRPQMYRRLTGQF